VVQSSQLQFSAATYHVLRTAASAVVTVVRTGSLADTDTVQYATSDGTAKAGTDYTTTSGTLTFAPGATAQTITISILDDQQFNGDESFTLTLSNPIGVASLLAPANTSLTINDPVSQDPMPGNLSAVANLLTHSAEYYTLFVASAYRAYLKRTPDAGGLATWVSLMQSGRLTDEQLEGLFLGSREYIQAHGGTGPAWVTGMYQDLLGRNPDANGLAYWTTTLADGANPAQVALSFAASGEREGQRIAADYQIFLGRTLDTAGQAGWLNAFLNGLRNETVIGNFVGSAEYYQKPIKGQDSRRAWVLSAFADILHRAPTDAELNLWLSQLS
jgi:hypothetical protein